VQRARHVIVACGAVQSARLLLMSGPPQASAIAMIKSAVTRCFTYSAWESPQRCRRSFREFYTANSGTPETQLRLKPISFRTTSPKATRRVFGGKAGTMTSTAKKNPLENADGKLRGKSLIQRPLLAAMEAYNRTLEVRLTADDLPMASNRVDLDPAFVDEYGFPSRGSPAILAATNS